MGAADLPKGRGAGKAGARAAGRQRASRTGGGAAAVPEPLGPSRPHQSCPGRQPRRAAGLLRRLYQAMSTETPPTASTLEDYLDLLQALAEHGIDYVVIGGCAVAAYA